MNEKLFAKVVARLVGVQNKLGDEVFEVAAQAALMAIARQVHQVAIARADLVGRQRPDGAIGADSSRRGSKGPHTWEPGRGG